MTESEMKQIADEAQARATTPAQPDGRINPFGLTAMLERHKARGKEWAARWRIPFDSISPCIPCEKHPEILRPKDWEATFETSCLYQEFKPIYAPCLTCGDEESRARKRRYWARRGLPERLAEATFQDFETPDSAHAEAKEFAMKIACRKLTFLLLLGDNGRGKSHLGAAALKQAGEGLFIEHKSLIDEIRASYGTNKTVDVIERYQDAPILVLDEVGMTAGGKDEQVHLHDILAKRHDFRRPTIITSNKSVPEIKEILGFRLIDRICQDYECRVLRGESYRRKTK